jgi:hypothetical protein
MRKENWKRAGGGGEKKISHNVAKTLFCNNPSIILTVEKVAQK